MSANNGNYDRFDYNNDSERSDERGLGQRNDDNDTDSVAYRQPNNGRLGNRNNRPLGADKRKNEQKNIKKKPLLTRKPTTQWEVVVGQKLPKEKDHSKIDYVLVYKKIRSTGLDADEEWTQGNNARKKFLAAMKREGMAVEKFVAGEYAYLKIHTSFWRLCKEAEHSSLEMPIKDFEVYDDDELCPCWTKCVDRLFRTDNEVDYGSVAFIADKIHLFQNGNNADEFFRPSIRSLLTYQILINMDMRKFEDPDAEHVYNMHGDQKQGLLFLLNKKYYCDAYCVHDPTDHKKDPHVLLKMIRLQSQHGQKVNIDDPVDADIAPEKDARRVLNDTWTKFYKFQPLWKIRNYFGEKIALYFAWCGVLMTTLWLPMLFGVACFIYGLYLSIRDSGINSTTSYHNSSFAEKAKGMVEDSISIVKESFDNVITPFYALFITIWGTVFVEVWKRRNARLAYEWDVDTFETFEIDRPQFVGTMERDDPIVKGQKQQHSPWTRQCIKFTISLSFLLLMVCLVFIVAAAIILYRIVITVNYCGNWSPAICLVVSTIVSSVLNAIAILILGLLYDWLAVKLTNWENHRTQTEYNDSLIMKLFAFQFANSYTSLFYIAFFRGRAFQNGIFGLGSDYVDTCGDTGQSSCMPMLSFQVLVLMLTKPIPKFLSDILIPLLVRLWHKKLKGWFRKCRCCCQGEVGVEGGPAELFAIPSFVEREREKATSEDFTRSEYTEKVIIYGFLMLFAASFPLAPLIALLLLMIDIRVDAKRMLWLDRRPVAEIAQDIGMWHDIIQFLNIVGVVTNACLIAFTSTWGAQYDITGQLVVVIVFEHIVFGVKYIIAAAIPDVPSDVKLAIKREKYQVRLLFDDDAENGEAVTQQLKAILSNPYSQKNRSNGEQLPEKGKEETNEREELYDKSRNVNGGAKKRQSLASRKNKKSADRGYYHDDDDSRNGLRYDNAENYESNSRRNLESNRRREPDNDNSVSRSNNRDIRDQRNYESSRRRHDDVDDDSLDRSSKRNRREKKRHNRLDDDYDDDLSRRDDVEDGNCDEYSRKIDYNRNTDWQ